MKEYYQYIRLKNYYVWYINSFIQYTLCLLRQIIDLIESQFRLWGERISLTLYSPFIFVVEEIGRKL